MKALVTGGAGFIGSTLADRLIELGHTVAVLDDLSSGKRVNLHPKALFIHLGLLSEGMEKAVVDFKPDVILHHAAQINVRAAVNDPAYDAGVNILGSIKLYAAAVRAGCAKVIYASSGGACYGDPPRIPADEDTPIRPQSPYGASKYTAEKYLQLYGDLYGLRFTVLRYANVYGPRQDPHGEAGVTAIFSEQMLDGKRPTIFGDGTKTRDYVFVEDIVRANILALDKGDGGVYNIGTGREVSDYQLFCAVRDAVGLKIEPEYADFRKGEVRRVALDASRAKRDLGWTASVPIEEGMPRAVAYYRAKRKAGG